MMWGIILSFILQERKSVFGLPKAATLVIQNSVRMQVQPIQSWSQTFFPSQGMHVRKMWGKGWAGQTHIPLLCFRWVSSASQEWSLEFMPSVKWMRAFLRMSAMKTNLLTMWRIWWSSSSGTSPSHFSPTSWVRPSCTSISVSENNTVKCSYIHPPI